MSLSAKGFTQQPQETEVYCLPEICTAATLEDFNKISDSSETLFTVKYCAGCSVSGHIAAAFQRAKVSIYLSDADGSELFGNIRILKKRTIPEDWEPGKLFAGMMKALEQHFNTLHMPIPEHITISNYLQQFDNQYATDPKVRELKLEHITPEFVRSWVNPEHAGNPKIIFAVRMKMIIVLTENNDSVRASFILGEILPRITEKKPSDLMQFMFIPNIMNIMSSCSQMLPHMFFFKQDTAQCAPYDVVGKLFQTFFDSQSAILTWELERLTALAPHYDSVQSFNEALQNKKEEVTVIEATKQDVSSFINELSKNQDLKDVFNRIINAMVEELIISHTILPVADKSDEAVA